MLTRSALARFLESSGAASLREFLPRQRWFAAKGRDIGSLGVRDWTVLREDPPLVLLLADVDGDRYYIPLSGRSGPAGPGVSADLEVARLDGHTLFDAHWDPEFGRQLLLAIAAGRVFEGAVGRFACRPVGEWTGPQEPEIRALAARPLGAEQSNTSLRLGDGLILKSFRRPQRGVNPDFEVTHFLTTRTDFRHAPRLEGWIEYTDASGATATVAMLQPFIANSGDGWRHALAHLRRLAEVLRHEAAPADPEATGRRLATIAGDFAGEMRDLGTITGDLHVALASDASLAPFRPEPVTEEADVARWKRSIAEDATRVLGELRRRSATLPEPARAVVALLLEHSDRLDVAASGLSVLAAGRTHKIRCHGDYHLGQVLKTAGAFVILDFEGEPARPVEERRAKHSPLRDVAGMLRSFNYAIHAAAAAEPPADRPGLAPWLDAWEPLVAGAFRAGYQAALQRSPVRLAPPSEAEFARACAVFELEKALYELGYELSHRPDWIAIPAAGIARILGLDRRHG